MNVNGNGGGGNHDWRHVFGHVLGMDIDEFVESMVTHGEDKTMVKVFDYINKVEYNEKESDSEGTTH